MYLVEEAMKIIEEQNEEKIKLGDRRDEYVHKVISLMAPVVKSWYLKTSTRFLNEHNFREEEEDLFADFTEFCTDKLDEMFENRRFSRTVNYPRLKS